MATKNNKKNTVVEASTDSLDEFAGEGQKEVQPTEPQAQPAADVNALFKAYDAAGEGLAAAKVQAKAIVDAAARVVSDSVKAIQVGAGRKNFNRKGKKLLIVSRITKGEGDAPEYTTYFFKGAKEETALEVE